MIDPELEELLSGYLDDELSPDERARVEQALAAREDVRQLYESLRAGRGELRSLPRHKVDHDLSSQVLRRAERAVLTGNETPGGGDVVPGSLAQTLWSRGGLRRFMWPAAAVAAALMIAFVERRQEAERQLAQNAPRASGSIDAPKTLADGRKAAESDAAPLTMSAPASSDAASRSDPPGGLSAPRRESPAESARETDSRLAKPSAGERSSNFAGPTEADDESRARLQAGRLVDSLVIVEDPLELIEIDVEPEYLREKRFEKLLVTNQIPFAVPAADSAAKDDLRARSTSQPLAKSLPGDEVQEYHLNATPEQVDQIVNTLRRDRSQVSRMQMSNLQAPLELKRSNAPAEPAAAGRGANAAQAESNRQSMVKIQLRATTNASRAPESDR